MASGMLPLGLGGSPYTQQPQGMLGGQPFGLQPSLPLMLGLGILANNQARPWQQGPPSMGAGMAQGVQNYLAYQQQAQEQALKQEQARREWQLKTEEAERQKREFGFKEQDRTDKKLFASSLASVFRGDGTFDEGKVAELAALNPDFGVDVLKEKLKGQDLVQRTVFEGGTEVQYLAPARELDRSKWIKIGSGARWKPDAPPDQGGVTTFNYLEEGAKAPVTARLNPSSGIPEKWTGLGWAAITKPGQKVGSELTSTTAGGLQGVTPSQAGDVKLGLMQREVATRQTLDVANQMREIVTQDPAVLQVPGALAQTVDSLASQVSILADMVGADTSKVNLNELDYSRFTSAAANTAEFKSAARNLAYAAAAASEQEGRSVSNADVQRFLDEIGASAGSPQQFTAALDSFTKRIQSAFEMSVEVNKREFPDLDYSPPALQGQTPPKPAANESEADRIKKKYGL